MKIRNFMVVLLLSLLSITCFAGDPPDSVTYSTDSMSVEQILDNVVTRIKPGDIVFQNAGESVLLAPGKSYIPNAPLPLYDAYLQMIGTYNHCGAVVRHYDPDSCKVKLFVVESPGGLAEDGITPIVGMTPLDIWLLRGTDHEFVVVRPDWGDTAWKRVINVVKFEAGLKHWIGTPYNFTGSWTNNRVYCSQIIWKEYERIMRETLCEGTPFSALDCTGPACDAYFAAFFGGEIPRAREIILPYSLSVSPKVSPIAYFGMDESGLDLD